MGFLLIISSLMAWPLQIMLASGGLPIVNELSGYVFASRSDWECWLLALVVFVCSAIAMPGLRSFSISNRNWLLLCYLAAQPLMLILLRWPNLVSRIWLTSESLSLTVFISALPGLVVSTQYRCIAKSSAMKWSTLFVASASCLAIDISKALGVTGFSWSLAPNATADAPWGLVLTLLLSGWLSSLLIPVWFLWSSNAEPLEDQRAMELQSFWKRFQSRPPKIYLWPTNCRCANAVLVGSMFTKKLLLTDKLLLVFCQRELEWIALHEMSHAMRYHYIVRLLPTIVALPTLYALLAGTEGLLLIASCLTLFIMFAGLIAASCWWTEWDADKQAIKLGMKHYGMVSRDACNEYAAVLVSLYGPNSTGRISWTHPSLQQRLAAITSTHS